MSQSKRFVIVSFFVTLSLSALCQGSYDIIKEFCSNCGLLRGLKMSYAVGLACFLIKYFIDDVVDDNAGQGERISRRSLATLIIGWMLFLFSALSVSVIAVSAAFWFVGVAIITWFMVKNRRTISPNCFRRYLRENVFLCFALFGLALPLVLTGMVENCWYQVVFELCLFVVAVGAFVVMLLDDTPDIKG